MRGVEAVMSENRIGDRATYTDSINYGVSTPDNRKAVREQRIEGALMAPVAAPGREEIQELSSFYSKTLESVEQIRYPFQFPDIEKNGPSEASIAPPQHSLSGTSSIAPVMPQYYNIASQMGRNIDAYGREAPLTREQQTILAASLSKYDLSTLQSLQQEGLRIRLYDSDNPPVGGYPGGNSTWDRNTLGLYRGNEKLLALRQKDFQRGLTDEVQDVVHHEVAHAVDDMLYPDSARGREMSTEHDPYMRQLYSKYKSRTALNQGYQWSSYAKTNVKEYFAEGVEFFMGSPEKRETLRQKDPELYAQVEHMLSRASGRNSTPAWNRNTMPYPIDQRTGLYPANYPTNYPVTMNNGQYWGPGFNTSTWPDNRYQVMAQYMMLCRLQWMMAMMMTQSMGIPRF